MIEGLDDDNPVEINGRFRLQQSTDYEKFLAFQGAPWPIRKAIMLDTGTVSIVETTHERVKFQQIGLVRQSFELEFDSDPVEHVMRIARVSRCCFHLFVVFYFDIHIALFKFLSNALHK